MDIRQRLREWYDAVEKRSYKEHVYILILGLAFILYLWLVFVFNDYAERAYQIQARVPEVRNKIDKLKSDIHQMIVRIKKQSQQKEKDAYSEFERLISGGEKRQVLVDPGQMNQVLKDILKERKGVALEFIETQSSQPFDPMGGEVVYKKILKLQFKANYFDTLNVLKKIETLPWVVLYDTIQYQVDGYPQAKVTLILYLLSKKEKWLSVARDAVDHIGGRML